MLLGVLFETWRRPRSEEMFVTIWAPFADSLPTRENETVVPNGLARESLYLRSMDSLKSPNILFQTVREDKIFLPLNNSPRPCAMDSASDSDSDASGEYELYGRYFRPGSTDIKLVDFGGATVLNGERSYDEISTLPCRAPEVVLQTGYDQSADLWSMGCILMEMYCTKAISFS